MTICFLPTVARSISIRQGNKTEREIRMNAQTIISQLAEGFGTNVLITFLSALLPLIVGIPLVILMHYTGKTIVPKLLKYPMLIFESIAPVIIVALLYFCIFANTRSGTFAVISALSVCFLGHLPQQFDARDSLAKNIVVSSIDLIASLFKWSTAVCSIIAVQDIYRAASSIAARTFDYAPYLLIALVITFVCLAVLYLARNLCRDLMK